ncbi:hypothetical protein BDW59DRAFT_63195 [Aspergillus cavernicola]|uniref:Secreted protein n=1 Tax=Aspergillus cavernicola TaxID=176166 RepID=A0ABR4IIM3_9EURO
MKLFTILTLPSLYSLSHALSAPIKGYGIWEPEWEVEALPGHTLKSRGTIEEVRSELLRINPDWDSHYVVERSLEQRDQSSSSSWSSEFSKRADFYEDGYLKCGVYTEADVGDVWTGINYLGGVQGRPGNGPGPGNCGRVSCGYDAAIWWCNDSPQAKQLESYDSIADGATAILQSCARDGGFSWDNKVSGQAFHYTNWNVIVRREEC